MVSYKLDLVDAYWLYNYIKNSWLLKLLVLKLLVLSLFKSDAALF